jgi:sugar (pentulose or hexulose) kinase
MAQDILAIDVGTTALKMAVFSPALEKRCATSRGYDVHIYEHGKADIEPEKWWQAVKDSCLELREHFSSVGVISFSVTTPGLTPMTADGTALGPAILFFDGRSHSQARAIRQLVGEQKFLRETCNLPVSGGSSLCSILWIKDNQPDVWAAAVKFGHCNTYMVKRMTGEWAIDPSTVSITGLYNTARHDLTWNEDVLALAEIPETKLPPLMQSYTQAGEILPQVAAELGLPRGCAVLCGGNDAVLAALSGGLTNSGDINYICGTCEITNVCVDHPVSSPNFNVRCHVIPDRWVTFFVLNTGGKALEWFHSVFCRDMTEDHFYNEYVPSVIAEFLASKDIKRAEADLPVYGPYLGGSRYALEQMQACFCNITLETTREHLLLSLLRGNATYQGTHLKEVARMMKLGRKVMTTGNVAKIRGFLEIKKRWTGDFEYEFQDQSSVRGAAMLGQLYLNQLEESSKSCDESGRRPMEIRNG